MSGDIIVGVADMRTGGEADTLVTLGLGSCVAIALHDPRLKVGGLAHIMLPSKTLARGDNPAKVPETAVPALLAEMVELGAEARRITARLVGGAGLFSQLSAPGAIQMGERNLVSVRKVLADHAIPIVGERVGGNSGRSVWFRIGKGEVLVRTVAQGEDVL